MKRCWHCWRIVPVTLVWPADASSTSPHIAVEVCDRGACVEAAKKRRVLGYSAEAAS